MRLAFVSGPYRAATEWQVEQNIGEAEAVALALWRAGLVAYCPHMNTAHFGGACPDSVWLEGNLEILRRCDYVVTTARWQESEGARAEIALARALGIPVMALAEALDLALDER